jgi:hypothetical protein
MRGCMPKLGTERQVVLHWSMLEAEAACAQIAFVAKHAVVMVQTYSTIVRHAIQPAKMLRDSWNKTNILRVSNKQVYLAT